MALQAYMHGPTEDLRRRGYTSALPPSFEQALVAVHVAAGQAEVEFTSELERVNNLGTSTLSDAFLRQLDALIFQFDEVQTVRYTVEGDCVRFWRIFESNDCHIRQRA